MNGLTDIWMHLDLAHKNLDKYMENLNQQSDDKMKENLIYLCNFYGVRHQIKRAQSEIFELNEAIIDYENAKDSIYTQDFDKLKQHVIEEYADTLNMLSQIIYSYGITDKEVRDVQNQKIARQLQRVEDESRNKTIDRIRKDDLV